MVVQVGANCAKERNAVTEDWHGNSTPPLKHQVNPDNAVDPLPRPFSIIDEAPVDQEAHLMRSIHQMGLSKIFR